MTFFDSMALVFYIYIAGFILFAIGLVIRIIWKELDLW